MKPTWSGWTEVIAAQNADVESHSECLYRGLWSGDDISWEPYHDFPWNYCSPEIMANAAFRITERVTASTRFLWEPVSGESTEWHEVDYPN